MNKKKSLKKSILFGTTLFKDEGEDVQRSLQAGMNAHLSKPVEPEHLYQTLGELIFEAEEAKSL